MRLHKFQIQISGQIESEEVSFERFFKQNIEENGDLYGILRRRRTGIRCFVQIQWSVHLNFETKLTF